MTAPAPDTARCASFIGARKIRVTRLDSCGRPVYGEDTQVVTNGFVSVEIEPESEEGDDYTTKTAGGDLCINDKGQDTIKWYTVAIEFCRVDPDLFALMNPAWQPVKSADGELTTGWRMGQKMDDTKGFALELWPKASNAGSSCLDTTGGGGDDFQVNGYFLLPWVVATAPDSWTFENDAATFSLNGRTKPGSLWGRGPYNVVRDKDGAPGKLVDPIDPGFKWPGVVDDSKDAQHVHAEVTTVKPPDDTGCGSKPLYNPDATAPTFTVTAATDNGMTGNLEVTNWGDLSPKSAVVDWGDGKHKPTWLAASSNGKASYTYADSDANTKMTVKLSHDNGHSPVTQDFTPKKSGSGSRDTSDDDTHTIVLTLTQPPTGEFAIDWGDGDIDTASGGGPHRHTYEHAGTYDVVTTDETGSEVTRDQFTVPKEQ